MLAGNSAYIPSSFESIATATPTGVASVAFTSIPQTYSHLQIRYMAKNATVANGEDNLNIKFNSSAGTNNHYLYTFGGSITAGNGIPGSSPTVGYYPDNGSALTSMFGVGIIDITDYASTTKTKVFRALTAFDANSGTYGTIGLYSGLFASTSAVTRIDIATDNGSNFVSGSTIALYGIK